MANTISSSHEPILVVTPIRKYPRPSPVVTESKLSQTKSVPTSYQPEEVTKLTTTPIITTTTIPSTIPSTIQPITLSTTSMTTTNKNNSSGLKCTNLLLNLKTMLQEITTVKQKIEKTQKMEQKWNSTITSSDLEILIQYQTNQTKRYQNLVTQLKELHQLLQDHILFKKNMLELFQADKTAFDESVIQKTQQELDECNEMDKKVKQVMETIVYQKA